ncbi:MAG: XRE family transcriptional regulator [Deltaproteobacteria bacterium]|nr:MAG: XRE family transcriptional regulator [Deltaproteobacteria bacterium]
MEKIRKALGQRIRTLRKAKNLTQEELAEKAGLSYKL